MTDRHLVDGDCMTNAEQCARAKTAIDNGQIKLLLTEIREYLGCTHELARQIRRELEPENLTRACICGNMTVKDYCFECKHNAPRREYYRTIQKGWIMWQKRPDIGFEIDVEHY